MVMPILLLINPEDVMQGNAAGARMNTGLIAERVLRVTIEVPGRFPAVRKRCVAAEEGV